MSGVEVIITRTRVGIGFSFFEGEILTLPRDQANAAIKAGWAEKFHPPEMDIPIEEGVVLKASKTPSPKRKVTSKRKK